MQVIRSSQCQCPTSDEMCAWMQHDKCSFYAGNFNALPLMTERGEESK